ncbi:hypothetical protein AB205_0140680 [Aquarana catesbeiana]|uniref:Uncharacterized protein n=1 Tax=Aquarana catesbeiana TaxID=8400 RepID=A0A2G9SA71_AQUCT|nr:hypothetical protein AB205_0140680 [Aquarana catesbeiana]
MARSDIAGHQELRAQYLHTRYSENCISGKGPAAGNADSPAGAFARISDTIPPMPPPQMMSGDGDEDEWES